MKNKEAKNVNFKLILFSLFFVWSIAEVVFSFIPQSQGNTPNGLARNIWFFYYSSPTNNLYYRDITDAVVSSNNKKNVLFVGDSYTYGQGIKQYKNRFTDIISDSIKSQFNVYNLGRVRSDTEDEFQRLMNYPVKPDVLVWQYYYNDIEGVARKRGYLNERKSNLFMKLIYGIALIPARSSFFLNYIIVNASKYAPLISKGGNTYHDDLRTIFKDSNCVNSHLNELKEVIVYSEKNNIKLYFLLIPDVVDPMFSKKELYDKFIIPFFNQHSCKYITFETELMKNDFHDLIVNDIDYHLNELGHSIIAKKTINSVGEFSNIK